MLEETEERSSQRFPAPHRSEIRNTDGHSVPQETSKLCTKHKKHVNQKEKKLIARGARYQISVRQDLDGSG